MPILVVGSKRDLQRHRFTQRRAVSVLVKKTWKCGYVECSAKYNWHVLLLFKELLGIAVARGLRPNHTSIRLQGALQGNRCNVMWQICSLFWIYAYLGPVCFIRVLIIWSYLTGPKSVLNVNFAVTQGWSFGDKLLIKMAGILPPRGLCNWCIHLMDYLRYYWFHFSPVDSNTQEKWKHIRIFFHLTKVCQGRSKILHLTQSIICFPFLHWFKFRCCGCKCDHF